jgi:hypothetical protein
MASGDPVAWQVNCVPRDRAPGAINPVGWYDFFPSGLVKITYPRSDCVADRLCVSTSMLSRVPQRVPRRTFEISRHALPLHWFCAIPL